jgi:hypothetical protein
MIFNRFYCLLLTFLLKRLNDFLVFCDHLMDSAGTRQGLSAKDGDQITNVFHDGGQEPVAVSANRLYNPLLGSSRVVGVYRNAEYIYKKYTRQAKFTCSWY